MAGIPPLAIGRSRNKYGAVRCELDGHAFDSKSERDHYAGNLAIRQMAGEIRGLFVHPVFPIKINDIFVCNVELDFAYTEVATGKQHVEDVKGKDNALSKLKRRMLEAAYPHLKVELIR
jgi:Protein of unknown function (DUF1064)